MQCNTGKKFFLPSVEFRNFRETKLNRWNLIRTRTYVFYGLDSTREKPIVQQKYKGKHVNEKKKKKKNYKEKKKKEYF